MRSPYDILGVAPDADEATLKKAYRKRAFETHPDQNSGNTAAFQEVNAAYELLSDPERRAHFDKTGETDNSKRQDAQQELINLFMQAIDRFGENAKLVEIVTEGVKQSREQMLRSKNAEIRKAAMLRRIAKRLKGDLLKQAVLNRAAKAELDAGTIDGRVQVADEALNILKECSYSWDAVAAFLAPGGGFI